MSDKIYPGIHPFINLSHFCHDEKRIVDIFAREFFITNGGGEIKLGPTSIYRYFLLKPTEVYQEMFNIERELVVIFSPYETFQPRTLDAFDHVYKLYEKLRIERVCCVLISQDEQIVNNLSNILKNDKEAQIIVPFSYEEILRKYDAYFMRNRFKEHFYTRDLFAFRAPLKRDLYFFGRKDLVHNIVNRHKANENSGLFGLRKTGKTSVIFGVERVLEEMEEVSVVIDCQTPAFHIRRWNKALYFIVYQIVKQNKLEFHLRKEEEYTEENAPIVFEEELSKLNKLFGNKPVMIIFDEIENMTFSISASPHWSKELDFVYFWQTVRSIFQSRNLFTYLIVGTNPLCVETPTISGKDNPIFDQVPYTYIPGFDVPDTREMVRKLGRIMGLKFDEIVYGKLTEDFGGHPFLIRHVCSVINRITPSTRPSYIDKTIYEQAKNSFKTESGNYIEMILEVLEQYYIDEYEMLKMLSVEDIETFKEFAALSPTYTNHLLGYGIINQNIDSYSFKIELVREYLSTKQKYRKTILSLEEKYQELSERRNKLEPKLRRIILDKLVSTFGKSKAKDYVLEIMGNKRKVKYGSFSVYDLFDPNKSEIYFDDLRRIAIKYWTIYKDSIDMDKQDFDSMMSAINRFRADAHAKDITDDQMNYFRVCITTIENRAI